jgi:hypothetical protein
VAIGPGAGSLGTQVALQFPRIPYITRRFANGVSFRAIGSPASASRKARRLGWAPSRTGLGREMGGGMRADAREK